VSARQLLGLLRARDRRRRSPRTHPISHRDGTLSTVTRPGTRCNEWVDAAGAVRSLRTSRIGSSATRIGMLDLYSDFTQVHAQTGAHVEVLEIDDLVSGSSLLPPTEGLAQGDEIRATFEPRRCWRRPNRRPRSPPEVFEWSAARRGRTRQAGRGLRARRPDYYYRAPASTSPSASPQA